MSKTETFKRYFKVTVLIVKKCFVQVKSFTQQQIELTQFKQLLWQVKIKNKTILHKMFSTQLKVYIEQNKQNEVVPLETSQTRLVSV